MDQAATSRDDQQPLAPVDAAAVGRRIAQARHEAGWMTQETLAELLCICKRSVQTYESGTRVPYRHLHRLAEIFERPASWFLHGHPAGSGGDATDEEILKRLDLHAELLGKLAVELAALRRALRAPEPAAPRDPSALPR
jgi:transcriptional regulator with XRE-family HTH domain